MRLSNVLWLVLLVGCIPVQPNNDPVIVNTERSYTTAFDTVQAFLEYDDAHRNFMKTQAPTAHLVAEDLRRTSLPAFRAVRVAEDAYRSSKSAADGDKLNATLTAVEKLAASAREALTAAQAAKG